MLILEGCVQPDLAPQIDEKIKSLFDRLGISLVSTRGSGCCGALSSHMGAQKEADSIIRQNIDLWHESLSGDFENLIVTSTGCSAVVLEYPDFMDDGDPYRKKAEFVSQRTSDPAVLISEKFADRLKKSAEFSHLDRIAVQTPCSMQHAMKSAGHIEKILTSAGYSIAGEFEPTLCCGSAGAYSILEKDLSHKIRTHKIKSLMTENPQAVATANIGCQLHLNAESPVPVIHWAELVDVSD